MPLSPSFRKKALIFFGLGLAAVSTFYIPFIPFDQLPRLTSRYCPLLARMRPIDHTPIQPTDWVEVSTFINTSPRTIRLYGDGRIERDTTFAALPHFVLGCPLHEADRHLRISQAFATTLITNARDAGFCKLCSIYQSRHERDVKGMEQITLRVGNNNYRVANISGNPPAYYEELAASLLSLAPMPEYATGSHPTDDRMQECAHFQNNQVNALSQALHAK